MKHSCRGMYVKATDAFIYSYIIVSDHKCHRISMEMIHYCAHITQVSKQVAMHPRRKSN